MIFPLAFYLKTMFCTFLLPLDGEVVWGMAIVSGESI